MRNAFGLRAGFGIAAAVSCLGLGASSALAANTVYWGNYSGTTLGLANLDGSGGGSLALTGTTPDEMWGEAIDSATGTIYFANCGSNTISWERLDGSAGGTLPLSAPLLDCPSGVAIDTDTNRLYWANDSGDTIGVANLDGSDAETLNTTGATLNGPNGLAIDASVQKVYWANLDDDTIAYANLDGSGGGGQLNTTGAAIDGPYGVAIDPDNNELYVANGSSNSISYVHLDGSGGGQLDNTGATLAEPVGVAVDPATNTLYTANFNNNSISYMNLDNTGGGGQLSLTGASDDQPLDPILLLTPSAAGAPAVTGGTTPGTTLSCSQGSWGGDMPESQLYQEPASFSYSWTLNGSAIPGAASASITAASAGRYVCNVTATNNAGSTTQASAAQEVTSPAPATNPPVTTTPTTTAPATTATPPTCSLRTKKAGIYTSASAARKHKAKIGELQVTASCDQAATLVLSGVVTAAATKGKHHKRKRAFAIRSQDRVANAGARLTLTVKLPAAAISALKIGRRESVVFKLRATSGQLSTTTRATIGRLRLL